MLSRCGWGGTALTSFALLGQAEVKQLHNPGSYDLDGVPALVVAAFQMIPHGPVRVETPVVFPKAPFASFTVPEMSVTVRHTQSCGALDEVVEVVLATEVLDEYSEIVGVEGFASV